MLPCKEKTIPALDRKIHSGLWHTPVQPPFIEFAAPQFTADENAPDPEYEASGLNLQKCSKKLLA